MKPDDFTVLKSIDEQRLPGLNEILSTYNARHGINIQKEEMHAKFNTLPKEYFLQRPMDTDFLEYSVRDVEDLVEVYHEMKEIISNLCKEIF